MIFSAKIRKKSHSRLIFSKLVGDAAIALGGTLQGFVGHVLLVERAAGLDSLRRAAVANDAYQCPAFRRVGKLVAHQRESSVYCGHLLSRHADRMSRPRCGAFWESPVPSLISSFSPSSYPICFVVSLLLLRCSFVTAPI